MDTTDSHLPPGDPQLVNNIVNHLKSQGIFDQFRHDCLADVDTKPSYQNLRQRVDGFVTKVLSNETWSPDLNKNQLRNNIRKQIDESGMLAIGVEHVVEQVVNAKMYQVFLPKIEDIVKQYLGLKMTNEGTLSNNKNDCREISNSDMKIELPFGGSSKKDNRTPDSVIGKISDILRDNTSEDFNALTNNTKNKVQKEMMNTIAILSKSEANPTKSDALKHSNESSTAREFREPDIKPFANFQGNNPKAVLAVDMNESKGTVEVKVEPKSHEMNSIVDGKNILQNDVITKLDKSWIKQREKARLKYEEPKSKANENISNNYKQTTNLSSKLSSSVSESSKAFSEQSKSKHAGSIRSKSSESPKSKVSTDNSEKIYSKAKTSAFPKHHGHKTKMEFQEDNKSEGKSREYRSHRGKNDMEQTKIAPKQDHKAKGNKMTSEEKNSPSSETFNKYDASSKHQHGVKSSSTPKKEGKDEKIKHNRKEFRSTAVDHSRSRDTSKVSQDSAVNSDRKNMSQTSMSNSTGKNVDKNKGTSSNIGKMDSKEAKSSGRNHDKNSQGKSKLNDLHSKSRSKTDAKSSLKSFEKSSEFLKMVKAHNEVAMKDSFTENSIGKRSQKTNEVTSKISAGKLKKDLCNDGKRCNTPPPQTNLQHKAEVKSKKKQDNSKTFYGKDLVFESSNMKLSEITFPCFSSSDESLQESFNQKSESDKDRDRLSSKSLKALNENDDDVSDSDWSNVTISSVHTSDLSSFDDRISLSSDGETEQKSKRMKRNKKKVPLKEVKQIAQEFDGKGKDESELKENQEKMVRTYKRKKEKNVKMSKVSEVVNEEKYSSSEKDSDDQCSSAMFKRSLEIRRKRKLNPKYASSEFTSIFTPSEDIEAKDSQDVSDSSDHHFTHTKVAPNNLSKIKKNDISLNNKPNTMNYAEGRTGIIARKANDGSVKKSSNGSSNDSSDHCLTPTKNVCSDQSKIRKDNISLDNKVKTMYSAEDKTGITSKKSNDTSTEKNNTDSSKIIEKHQYTIHGCEYSSSADFSDGSSASDEEISAEDGESDGKTSLIKENSISSYSSNEDNISKAFSNFSDSFKNMKNKDSVSSDSESENSEVENQRLPSESSALESEYDVLTPEVSFTDEKSDNEVHKDQSRLNNHSTESQDKKLRNSSESNCSESSLVTSSKVVIKKDDVVVQDSIVRKRGRPRKHLLTDTVAKKISTNITPIRVIPRKRNISVSSEQPDVPETRKRCRIDPNEKNAANDIKKSRRQSIANNDSWDLTNRPKRRLSELSQSDTPSKTDSSKFYDSSDLYKPRPVISSSTRRSRVHSPT